MSEDRSGFSPFRGHGEFMDLVGPVFARGEGEERVLALEIEQRHVNDVGTAHGGLLTALADFALGRAINDGADAKAVTVSLTTDFLGPANVGDWVEAHTEVERLGEKLAFADCSLTVEGKEIVRARAVFAVVG